MNIRNHGGGEEDDDVKQLILFSSLTDIYTFDHTSVFLYRLPFKIFRLHQEHHQEHHQEREGEEGRKKRMAEEGKW